MKLEVETLAWPDRSKIERTCLLWQVLAVHSGRLFCQRGGILPCSRPWLDSGDPAVRWHAEGVCDLWYYATWTELAPNFWFEHVWNMPNDNMTNWNVQVVDGFKHVFRILSFLRWYKNWTGICNRQNTPPICQLWKWSWISSEQLVSPEERWRRFWRFGGICEWHRRRNYGFRSAFFSQTFVFTILANKHGYGKSDSS